jgi:hypothetical protein
MTLHQLAEKLQQDLIFAAPELHTMKIVLVLEAAVLEERDACCAVLASAEPNTRAEAVIEKLQAVVGDCPPHVAGLIAEWLEATADELADLQKAIRARGPNAGRPGVTALGVTKIELRPNGEWARFLFDDEGMLSVCSSCGNYGFTFSAPGTKGLRAFLIDGGSDVDYFKGKFEYQFHGKLSRRQQAELDGFFKRIWPAFIEALRAETTS